MVNLIGRISTGSKMDQIYLPKSRPPGFSVGAAVEIVPTIKKNAPCYTYHVPNLEPLKSIIKDEIFSYFEHADNTFIVGSFLEEGFHFNDIDVLVISEPGHEKSWSDYFKWKLGLSIHIICIDRKSLQQGLQQDPLFQMMMSKYIARKREIFRYKNAFNYKLLDLHLHKSKTILDSFEILAGKEKYNLTRNMLCIKLFLQGRRLSSEIVEKEMKKVFGEGTPQNLRENVLNKDILLKKFKKTYDETFEMIIKGLQHEPQQK